jgi:phage regulator Rha-like protein
VIAKGLKLRHRSVIQLVRKHLDSLKVLGRVQFQIAPFSTGGGVQSCEVALLNEHQAALLISMMRNTEKVLEFKVALIKEFFRMRDDMQGRNLDLWAQMQALIAKEVESKVHASFGSHLMLQRKREIPHFNEERTLLENQIQPSLFIH